jgi:hypothetical protein
MEMTTTSLYRHFNATGVLLYVGIATDHHIRFRSHLKLSEWKDKIATVTVERFSTRAEAEAAEVAAIQTEEPLYNSCHQRKGSRGDVLRWVFRQSDKDDLEDLIDDCNSDEPEDYRTECLESLKGLCEKLRIDFDATIAPRLVHEAP